MAWVTVGSMVLARLIFRPSLPDALLPTMAVMVAPAAVASLALFFASGGHITTPIAVLAGYGLLMVLAQLPLIPRYARLDFSIGTWAFTFSWAAVASTALFWVSAENPVGKSFLSYLILTAITALVGVIALRTLIAIRRRSLLAAPAQPVASRLPDNYDQVVAH